MEGNMPQQQCHPASTAVEKDGLVIPVSRIWILYHRRAMLRTALSRFFDPVTLEQA